MNVICVFPGQNSRYPDMIDRVRQVTPIADEILATASEVLSRDLRTHFEPANTAMFARNRDVQVGVFLASHILVTALEAEGIHAVASAGLSLGEYNHLVHAGALRFEDALRLLEARGDAYDRAPRGLMVSVFPCEAEHVEQALEGPVDIGLQLGRRHFVLSGERAAVETAAARLEEQTCAQVRTIDDALPMHSRVFRPAAEEFRTALDGVPWRTPRLPYLPNVDGRVVVPATRDAIVDRLYRHVFTRVRWSETVGTLVRSHPAAPLVEVGPKSILSDLFVRDYRGMRSFRTDDANGGFSVFRPAVDALRHAGG
jgi:[acyl-carrier-protein] S-malonyltransferase